MLNKMKKIINTSDKDFDNQFSELLNIDRNISENVEEAVRNIVQDVKSNGDNSLVRYTNKFDKNSLSVNELLVSDEEIDTLVKDLSPKLVEAIDLAYSRVESYHKKQIVSDLSYEDEIGTKLGYICNPISSVGIYVPGGTASYPSTVLMNAIPAKVAGVEDITMVSPSTDSKINPSILYAARKVGINRIYRIGGAQAISALAFGTETIKPVDKIVGPGNIYVSESKRQVFGDVGIDMFAGPSEIVIIADKENDPGIIASDLIAQAEHDVNAQSILITDDASLADKVLNNVDDQISSLPRKDIVSKSWNNNGSVIIVSGIEEAIKLANKLAPEHLELALKDANNYIKEVKNAGAIFIGNNTPEAIGDYIAGPSHVLPTSKSARFSSGLSVNDFIKKTSVIECSEESLNEIGRSAVEIAINEGLDGHARSIEYRLSKK